MEQLIFLPALGSVLRPEVMVFMIPITAIVLGIGSGIITSFQKHQLKMAELMHKNREVDPRVLGELQSLRAEVAELRDRVNQATLATDNFNRLNLTTPPNLPQEEIERRIEQRPG